MGLIVTRGLGIDVIYKSVPIHEIDTTIVYAPGVELEGVEAEEVKELELFAIYTKREIEE